MLTTHKYTSVSLPVEVPSQEDSPPLGPLMDDLASIPMPEHRREEIEAAISLLQEAGTALTNDNVHSLVKGRRTYVTAYMKVWRARYRPPVPIAPSPEIEPATSYVRKMCTCSPGDSPCIACREYAVFHATELQKEGEKTAQALPLPAQTTVGKITCLRCNRRFESPDIATIQLCRQCCTTIARHELGLEEIPRLSVIPRQQLITEEMARVAEERRTLDIQIHQLQLQQKACEGQQQILQQYLHLVDECGEWAFFNQHVLQDLLLRPVIERIA